MSEANLVYGQRVTICDETAASFGRVGRYEGVISEELGALRVRFPGGVIVAYRHQLLAVAHAVCVRREVKAAGKRAPRPSHHVTPPCYLKDYGPTAAQRAAQAWEQGLDNDDPETFRSLWDEMQRTHFAERHPRAARRLTRERVINQTNREAANDRRWLRTRKSLRAIARRAA